MHLRMSRRRRPDHDTMADIATGLGLFSIGLGIAELVAPRSIARHLGMEDEAELIRAYGIREVAAGIGILAQRDPTPWLWGRVAGDVLDLATLALGLDHRNPRRGRVGAAIGMVAAVTLLDVVTAKALGNHRTRAWMNAAVERSGVREAPRHLRHYAEEALDRGRLYADEAAHRGSRVAERARSYLPW